eukprot:8183384-Pyramimonas_sp.AAC.1
MEGVPVDGLAARYVQVQRAIFEASTALERVVKQRREAEAVLEQLTIACSVESMALHGRYPLHSHRWLALRVYTLSPRTVGSRC